MALPDTLLLNGTDLQGIAGVVVTKMNLWAPGRRRGDDIVIPYASGATGVANQPYEAYEFGVEIAVLETDGSGATPATGHLRRAQMVTNLRSVATAIGTTGLVSLTRRLAKSPSGYDSHTASGRFVDGLDPEQVVASHGETTLRFVNLDGCWFAAAAPTTPIVP